MHKDYTILFRKGPDLQHEEEYDVAKKYFNVVEYRSDCPLDQTVIGRYSVLPFYQELEHDLNSKNSKIINSYREHSWIADFDYYYDLKEFTAESWTDFDFYKCSHPGPFVLKGKTNSRKQQWNTMMFAKDKKTASIVASQLANDPLIGPQGIIYRKYIPLVTFEVGINDLPFTNEWRIFYYKGQRLSYGYYWTNLDNFEKINISEEALIFADDVAKIAKDYVNFFVLDIAEKQEGGWVLIEVNDGCMSGLSANDPGVLYKNLSNVL